jgi:electron transfer flavoprotein beta subunit
MSARGKSMGSDEPDRDRPLVVVFLAITDLRPEVDPLTGSVRQDPWGIGLSPADEAALEHALRACEAWSGRVLAVTAGPATVEPVLRQIAALGASVLRVPLAEQRAEQRAEHGYARELAGDERELANVLLEAIEPYGPPMLILCGDRSVDRGTGALPAFLAHQLGASQALGLVKLEASQEGDTSPGDRVVLAERRLDGGWRERLRVPTPAVCSVEGAGTRLRQATLAGALEAQKLTVPLCRARGSERAGTGAGADRNSQTRIGPTQPFVARTHLRPAPEGDPRIRLLALTGALTSTDPPTVIGPIGSREAADELLGYLVRNGYLEQLPDPGEVVEGGEP